MSGAQQQSSHKYVPAMAPLIVPGSTVAGVQTFSRAQAEGAVRTTVSNLPYASVTDMRLTEAGPYSSSVSCGCGQLNPDSCVHTTGGTAPFLDSKLSHTYLKQSYDSSPYLAISPVQAYLQLRAAPFNQ